MHRLPVPAVVIAIALTIAAGCDNTNKPTETIAFTAVLSPANEVPLVTNSEASGAGIATIVLHVARDSAGSISIALADFQVALSGFPANTPLTMAHIHRGGVGVAGDIVVNTGLNAGEVTLTSGAGTFAKNGVSLQATLAQEIVNNPSNFYFNVHTVANPAGVARGQVTRQ